jgi:catecholate siderophore receptor
MRLSLNFRYLVRRAVIGVFTSTILTPVAASLALAQGASEPSGSDPHFVLRGHVVDVMHAPIVGARVSVASEGGPAVATTVSDQHGDFSVALEVGRVILTIAADGFVAASLSIVAPKTGADERAFVLQVDGIRETVSVAAPAGYEMTAISSSTKSNTPLRDVPQSITVVTKELIRDQQMTSIADVVRYVPGIMSHQGENNRDQLVIRGNNSSADFFLDGVRDDVQYYRDLYNLDRVEALKGPNAMIFGRGGGGGVVNRVSKAADFLPIHEFTLLGGSFGHKRLAADVDRPLGNTVAFRVNGVYENSDSFRQYVNLERYGIAPTLTFAPNQQTRVTVGYEHFRDNRVADRGVPSFQGLPSTPSVSTYFGNPSESSVNARVDAASATIDRQAGNWNLHNRTLIGGYERAYQNFVPGAVTADKTQVSLSAYNNDTDRVNVFNQTDITYTAWTGPVGHTLLGGAEVGRQFTDNFRNTGFFNNSALTILVPYNAPTIRTPVTFRQSVTDADNHLRASVGAVYGQDRIELSRIVQVLAGLRFDAFTLQYHNNRNGDDLSRTDHLVSPRFGVVIKPTSPLSLYGSYTVSYLPSSGDQFSSLTVVTEQVKPEKFENYEFGAKWDLVRGLALTTALYRLDRTNTRSNDPNDPTRIVQTGSQRTNGIELGVNGRVTQAWQIAGGYAYQDAFVTSATIAARAGAQVAQVPHHTLSLWNAYQINPRLGAGLGIVHRTDMFAGIDNTVTLPGYIDVDAAVYLALTTKLRLQGNIENLFDRTYYVNADNNNNISPGSPRAIRVSLIARF